MRFSFQIYFAFSFQIYFALECKIYFAKAIEENGGQQKPVTGPLQERLG